METVSELLGFEWSLDGRIEVYGVVRASARMSKK